MKTWVSS